MKRTLYLKMLTGYLLFGVIGFILISTFTSHFTKKNIQQTEAKNLYREANQIAQNYGTKFMNKLLTPEALKDHLNSIAAFHDSDIWVVGSDGRLLVSAQHSGESAPVFIEDFDITAFGSSYYQTGNFYNYFKQDYISVYAPITINYTVKAYIFIHEPLSRILSLNNHILNVSYLSLGILFLVSFLVLAVFTFTVYIPIQKISSVAVEYSTGNFRPSINITSNDEIGYLAKTLNYMATRLGSSEEDQRKFVANISHDFRSPLTSIKGYVEAILDGTVPEQLQERYLNIILTEANRLTKLTNSLLDLNKCGSSGSLLEITDFDINQTIRTIAQSCEGPCQEKEITISLILSGEKMYVSADVGKIQQIIYNLLDNAIKFSNPSSTIIMETICKNEKLFVSVKDTGIGIPKDNITDIWNRFYKSDLSRGKDKKGTGLGLSIVKEIIQAHGETINVISTEGVGTEFIFTLSLSESELG